jgi:hypothetical protein
VKWFFYKNVVRFDIAEYHTVSVYEVQSCKELAEYQLTLLSIRRLHTTRGLESGAKGVSVRSALGWKSCVERVRRILCNWCVEMLLLYQWWIMVVAAVRAARLAAVCHSCQRRELLLGVEHCHLLGLEPMYSVLVVVGSGPYRAVLRLS